METDAPETFRGIFMHPLPLLNGKMTGAFAASDIETAVASGVRGGWKQIGDIVFVDVKFNLVNSYKDAVIMKNLPVPRNDRSILAAANMSASCCISCCIDLFFVINLKIISEYYFIIKHDKSLYLRVFYGKARKINKV